VYANWDRLGNISAAVNYLQLIKKQVTKSLKTNYQGSTHTDADTWASVWKVANKSLELLLQDKMPDRDIHVAAKSTVNLRAHGRQKFESSSLATFSKKVHEIKSGQIPTPEDDELPPAQLELDLDNDNGDSENVEERDIIST
jgi:hypothetical protein